MLLTFSMPVVPAEAALTCVKDWSDKMKISELIRKLDYHFNTLKGEAITDPAKARELRGTTISGIVNDSRKVIKDSLFFCIVGAKKDGHEYARQALHNLLVSHGEAVKLFREKKLESAKIGVVVDVWRHYPARPGNAEDEAMALTANEIAGFGWFLHPLFLGGYSDVLTAYMKEKGFTPEIREGDFETIRRPVDFYGLNFYNGLYDNADEARRAREIAASGGNYQERPEQHPEAISRL